MISSRTDTPSELRAALLALRPHFRWVAGLSTVCTLLVLVPTAYMLEVYGRVLSSRSLTTLAMLTVIALALYALMEILRWARSGVMVSAGLLFETRLRERIFDVVFEANVRGVAGGSQQAFYDLRTLRNVLLSPAVMALFDAPVSLVFLCIVFWVHPLLGWMSVTAAVAQLVLTYRTEKLTLPPLAAANREAIHALDFMGEILRNSPLIAAMGMLPGVRGRWSVRQDAFLMRQAEASNIAGRSAAMSKMLQTTLSSALLGVGAWLSLDNQLNGGSGMMIVAWILGPRAITPLIEVVGAWKGVAEARDAYDRLDRLLQAVPAQETGIALPAPTGRLRVDGLFASAPATQQAILVDINLEVPAGHTLAVVGPSGSGKSALARVLTGIWPARGGSVRLDGVDIYLWNKAELGPHVGYLPQDLELFDGTVGENIARFGLVDMVEVEAAARLAGIHETIEQLPEGYQTIVGGNACFLSGGQRQLVGFARAIYGQPKYLVLDEPNSNLDEAGDAVLVKALQVLKQRGTTMIVVTHRPNVLVVADLMLILREGRLLRFGDRDEVLESLTKPARTSPPAPPPQAVLARY